MAPQIRTVAVITKIGSNEAEAAAAKVIALLAGAKIEIYSLLPLSIDGAIPARTEDLAKLRPDLAVAIGGDGTTIRAFRTIPGKTPLFAINSGGHRGILSEIDSGSIDSSIKAVVSGNYFYDSRIRIQAFAGNVSFPPALNDLLITRVSLTRTPAFSIKLMGDEIRQRMDGIVVSTPTGSTGHSFSIGGPVLHEGMNCLILSPLASVNRMPQLIVPVEEITIQSSHESHLIVDGQETFKVEPESPVRIVRYTDDAVFLRLQKKGMRQLAKLGFSRLAF